MKYPQVKNDSPSVDNGSYFSILSCVVWSELENRRCWLLKMNETNLNHSYLKIFITEQLRLNGVLGAID